MTVNRPDLMRSAKEILKEKGFKEDQIFENFTFRSHQLDVVGWSKERRVAIKLGYCEPETLEELQKFFDEVICLYPEEQKPSVSPERKSKGLHEKAGSNKYSGIRLKLTRGKDTLFEVPLSIEGWTKDRLEDELASFEEEFNRLSKLFDALSHETRLKMMKHILEDDDQTISFAEFMRDLDLNPKLVWENTRKLHEGGLLDKVEKGRYRCSEFGRIEFMMNLALRRLMRALEELDDL